MTSNLASQTISDDNLTKTDLSTKVWEVLQAKFRPEFLNRVDQIIIYEKLKIQQIQKIVDIQLGLLAARLKRKNINLEFTSALRNHLAKTGYDAVFGARPLKRLIQTEIEDELALQIIEDKIKPGSAVSLDYDHNRLTLKQNL